MSEVTDTRRDVAERLEAGGELADHLCKSADFIRSMVHYTGRANIDDVGALALAENLDRAAALLRSEGREPDAWYDPHATVGAHGPPFAIYRSKVNSDCIPVYFGTPSDSPAEPDTVFLCAKCGYGSEEHGVEGHPAGQCIADMRLVPAAYRRASDSPTGEPVKTEAWKFAGQGESLRGRESRLRYAYEAGSTFALDSDMETVVLLDGPTEHDWRPIPPDEWEQIAALRNRYRRPSDSPTEPYVPPQRPRIEKIREGDTKRRGARKPPPPPPGPDRPRPSRYTNPKLNDPGYTPWWQRVGEWLTARGTE